MSGRNQILVIPQGGGGGVGVQSVVAGSGITVDNTDPNNPIVSANGVNVAVVANYSALPSASSVSGQFYWCSSSQGTAWLPGSLGGTYYSSGLYYSNGTTWEYTPVPYQATQGTVNTGTNNDQFVTPLTLTNSTQLSNKISLDGTSPETTNFIKMGDTFGLQGNATLKLKGTAGLTYNLTLTDQGFNFLAIDGSFSVKQLIADATSFRSQGANWFIQQSSTETSLNNVILDHSLITIPRRLYIPDEDGIFALISDIPSLTGYVQTSRTLTINGNTLDLSADRSWTVGDVLIGGNTVASNMLIGTNSNFGLNLETNTIIRQTIDNDGLVTFNGTTGNTGIVRMRQLQILNFSGSYNLAINSPTFADRLEIGNAAPWTRIDFLNSSVVLSNNTISFSGSGQIQQLGTITGVNSGLTLTTFNHPSTPPNITIRTAVVNNSTTSGTGNVINQTGDITGTSTTNAFNTGSFIWEIGSTVGTGRRGNAQWFGGTTLVNFQNMQRGFFEGNSTTAPNANPSSGLFRWVEGGDFKLRTSSGASITLGSVSQLPSLQILDFDGATWRTALSSTVTGRIDLGNSSANMLLSAANISVGTSMNASSSSHLLQFSRISGVSGSPITIGNPGNTTTALSIGGSYVGTTYQTTTSATTPTSSTNIITVANTGTGGSGNISLAVGASTGGGVRGSLLIDALNYSFNSVSAPAYNSMVGGVFIGNATSAPIGNPTGGGYLYVESGALKYRGSSGTVTTIAAA